MPIRFQRHSPSFKTETTCAKTTIKTSEKKLCLSGDLEAKITEHRWPEDVNGSAVGRRGDALGRVAERHRLDLAALLVVREPSPIGRTAAIQSTTLPQLHRPVIRTRREVRLIIAHTNPATAKHGVFFVIFSYSTSSFQAITGFKIELGLIQRF